MTPLEMIAEWRRGCSCAPPEHPEECHDCTRALIDALDRKLAAEAPKVDLPERVIDCLWQAVGLSTRHPDGDLQQKFYAFAQVVKAEVLARLPSNYTQADCGCAPSEACDICQGRPTDRPSVAEQELNALRVKYSMMKTAYETEIAQLRKALITPDRPSHAAYFVRLRNGSDMAWVEHGRDYAERVEREYPDQYEVRRLYAAPDRSSHAELYAALRSMHWSDGRLAVVEAKDLKLGVQTYSGEMLDAAIEQAIKASDHPS